MTKAYLIHGTSTRDDDWFPWLEQEAQNEGITIDRLWLPNPFNPNQREWNNAVDQQINATDGLTLVAHSLGCITALRFIERHDLKNANLVLVGAFDQGLPAYPELDPFMKPALNYSHITSKINQATVIAAKDDPIAPYQNSVQVANKINAKLIVQPTGGHFLTSDGFTKFPLVLKELTQIMN